MKTFHLNCQSLFSWENKENILECRLLKFLPIILSFNIKSNYCQYGIRISRITNAFARRDRDATHAGTIRKADAMSQTSFPSTLGRLSRKDIFDKEIPSRRDLFGAIEELCKYMYTWTGNQPKCP